MSYVKTSACHPPASITQNLTTPFLNSRGLTLVELVVVSLILGILTLMALPVYSDIKLLAKNAQAIAEMRDMEKAIIAFNIDKNGVYPADLTDVKLDSARDPWGNPYEYSPVCTRENLVPINGDFDLYSKGPDGLYDDDVTHGLSADDIIRAGDGGFLGTVVDYLP